MKQTVTINNGAQMPLLGFGVFQIPQTETADVVAAAIRAGYRHIDTAQSYLNETEVGQGIRQSAVAREDLFVTTKIWVENAGEVAAQASLERSFAHLKFDYLDLVLIHQPHGDYYDTWRVLEEWQAAGKIRSIGVSNFTPDRVVDLGLFNKVMPQVNQIEINPFHQRAEQIAALKNEGVIVQAWAPFAEGKNDIFQNEILNRIAQKHGKSAAQIILRWLVEQEISVLAKSVKPERMAQNLAVFDFALDANDRAAIATLDLGKSQFMDHQSIERVRFVKNTVFGV